MKAYTLLNTLCSVCLLGLVVFIAIQVIQIRHELALQAATNTNVAIELATIQIGDGQGAERPASEP